MTPARRSIGIMTTIMSATDAAERALFLHRTATPTTGVRIPTAVLRIVQSCAENAMEQGY